MLAWEKLDTFTAHDGVLIELRRRGTEYLIKAGGIELMSNQDDASSLALGTLGCVELPTAKKPRVLIGGLGMGYTLRAALDATPRSAIIEVAELVPAVAEWNRTYLADLAKRPLEDPRAKLCMGDVRERIRAHRDHYDAILLDVDNGPTALAHKQNDTLYSGHGIRHAWDALHPGGVLGVWSINDDHRFTQRLKRYGFEVRVERVSASRKGRGRFHIVWIARKSARRGRSS